MGILTAVMVPHPPLIVPKVGRGQQNQIARTVEAYQKAAQQIGALQPETIVLFSPHSVMYADYFHISPGSGAKGDFGQFLAEEVSIKADYDTAFVENLCRRAEIWQLAAGTYGERDARLDHGTMVPLYFVNQYWKDYKLVRIGLSGLPLAEHFKLGQCIRDTIKALGLRTALIASGDLSHKLKEDGPYGYSKEGPEYDRRIMEVMGAGDFRRLMDFPEAFLKKAAECGHRSFTILAGCLDGAKVTAHRLSYEGPFGVGYGICTYEVKEQL